MSLSPLDWAIIAAFSLGVAGLLGASVRETGETRRLLLVATVPSVAMGLGHLGFIIGVGEVTFGEHSRSLARMSGMWPSAVALSYLLKELVDLSWRQFGLLSLAILGSCWTFTASWFIHTSAEWGLIGLSVLLYIFSSYLLLGPYTRVADEIGGERKLLYGKLSFLFVLGWGALTLEAVVSPPVQELVTPLIAHIIMAYMDFIVYVGIGVLAVVGRPAFDTLDSGESSSASTDSTRQEQPV